MIYHGTISLYHKDEFGQHKKIWQPSSTTKLIQNLVALVVNGSARGAQILSVPSIIPGSTCRLVDINK